MNSNTAMQFEATPFASSDKSTESRLEIKIPVIPPISLTLVGFGFSELCRCFLAIDLYRERADFRHFYTFNCDFKDVLSSGYKRADGLMLVRIDDDIYSDRFELALQVINRYKRLRNLVVVPVYRPIESLRERMKSMCNDFPIYLNPNSEIEDFFRLISILMQIPQATYRRMSPCV